MEEELNENDLEDRMYAMLHHVDDSQPNVTEHSQSNDTLRIVESTPNSTVRRYWRQDATPARHLAVPPPAEPSPFIKTNLMAFKTIPKYEERSPAVSEPVVDTLFQTNPSKNLKTCIEFLDYDNEDQVLELVTSDEDEVIEVALPPKPTITIESSDEDVDQAPELSPSKKPNVSTIDTKLSKEREVSASPVPSVVSSVSDDFIRGDCIALNISSKRSANHSFDFGLHGSDLLAQDTPSKKKKRKKNKDTIPTSATVVSTSTPVKPTGPKQTEEYFATPKSKSKKKQNSKSSSVQENSVSQIDVYDSDSNQSFDATKKQTSYVVSDKSFPSIDVYESDSSQPESIMNTSSFLQQKPHQDEIKSSENSDTDLNRKMADPVKSSKHKTIDLEHSSGVIDLTNNTVWGGNLSIAKCIEENFVMANVTGLNKINCDSDNHTDPDLGQFGSTKIPAILNEDLDFDNLKGTDKTSSKRKFSAEALRAEMDKFYNESWGGENFNHREIQKRMSKDKSLWQIDPRDKIPMSARKKPVCGVCGRGGHRDDRCRRREPVCHMCGVRGHYEPRCPRKLCMNCGAPNVMYSSSCRQCRAWRSHVCAACGQRGHVRPACPDLWRRYHNTLEVSEQLVTCEALRSPQQLYCSGCARRGHLVHECRLALPFTAFMLTSPRVADYTPLYTPVPTAVDPSPATKRRSQSPAAVTHSAKRRNAFAPDFDEIRKISITESEKNRNISVSEFELSYDTSVSEFEKSCNTIVSEFDKSRNTSMSENEKSRNTSTSEFEKSRKTSVSDFEERPPSRAARKLSGGVKEANEEPMPEPDSTAPGPGDAGGNRDKRGRIIQDNAVSATSDAVTTARLYVRGEVGAALVKGAGAVWLQDACARHDVSVAPAPPGSRPADAASLVVTGPPAQQEAFTAELRSWAAAARGETAPAAPDPAAELPINRFNLIRKVSKALESLQQEWGDPNALYKELRVLRRRHDKLLARRVVRPAQLTRSRRDQAAAARRLNTVLLGQAGLAGGERHVRHLRTLRDSLCSLRRNTVPADVRAQLAVHYLPVFAPAPRDDYPSLLQRFYRRDPPAALPKHRAAPASAAPASAAPASAAPASAAPASAAPASSTPVSASPLERAAKKSRKRRKKKSLKNDEGIVAVPGPNSNVGLQSPPSIPAPEPPAAIPAEKTPQAPAKKPASEQLVNKTMQKLVFIHRRLQKTHLVDSGLKKRRVSLVRVLNSQIASLRKSKKMSSKTIKKMKKTHKEAVAFLDGI